MTKEVAQKHLDDIMDNLDFYKIHKVMTHLNWKWAGCDGVPHIVELRQKVRELFWGAVGDKDNLVIVASGGFFICIDERKDYVSCNFSITNFESL